MLVPAARESSFVLSSSAQAGLARGGSHPLPSPGPSCRLLSPGRMSPWPGGQVPASPLGLAGGAWASSSSLLEPCRRFQLSCAPCCCVLAEPTGGGALGQGTRRIRRLPGSCRCRGCARGRFAGASAWQMAGLDLRRLRFALCSSSRVVVKAAASCPAFSGWALEAWRLELKQAERSTALRLLGAGSGRAGTPWAPGPCTAPRGAPGGFGAAVTPEC